MIRTNDNQSRRRRFLFSATSTPREYVRTFVRVAAVLWI